MIATGIVVFELTRSPGLGAAIACTKFGWEDFLTARWLRRTDPDRRRGRTCFWLCVASGLWKCALTGIAVMFAVAFVEAAVQAPRPRGPGRVPPAAFFGASLAAFFGFGLSTLATYRAFAGAVRHRIKLWIDGRVHHDRRAGRWPPAATPPGRKNRAGAVLLTALVLTLVAALVATMVILGNAAKAAGRGGAGAPGRMVIHAVFVLTLFGMSLGLPVVVLIVRDAVIRRLLARSPAE